MDVNDVLQEFTGDGCHLSGWQGEGGSLWWCACHLFWKGELHWRLSIPLGDIRCPLVFACLHWRACFLTSAVRCQCCLVVLIWCNAKMVWTWSYYSQGLSLWCHWHMSILLFWTGVCTLCRWNSSCSSFQFSWFVCRVSSSSESFFGEGLSAMGLCACGSVELKGHGAVWSFAGCPCSPKVQWHLHLPYCSDLRYSRCGCSYLSPVFFSKAVHHLVSLCLVESNAEVTDNQIMVRRAQCIHRCLQKSGSCGKYQFHSVVCSSASWVVNLMKLCFSATSTSNCWTCLSLAPGHTGLVSQSTSGQLKSLLKIIFVNTWPYMAGDADEVS